MINTKLNDLMILIIILKNYVSCFNRMKNVVYKQVKIFKSNLK